MPSASDLIDALGGTTQVARLLGLKPPSVHEWRAKHIPLQWLVLLAVPIEKATAWRRWDLRPDDWYRIWPELVGAVGAPSLPLEEEVQRAA